MIIKTFKEILAWQKAHELALDVYKITAEFPKYEIFGLVSQMRRGAVSVPSNIAEGFKRKHLKDSLSFYNIAEASLEELKYQMLLAKDIGYTDDKTYDNTLLKAEETGRLLCGWIKSQK
ncbi:MAG: four helix bundle protein [Patescibacteria group bacterium]|nr:four helix bundle protein [Patescibacteria group bacterium]